MMLAAPDRQRLLGLMGVPMYVQRAIPEPPKPRVVAVSVPAGKLAVIGTRATHPGLQRDLLRALGQVATVETPRDWPNYAVLLSETIPVPASVIAVAVPTALHGASGKRALWRQLRPLLAASRPG